MSTLERIAPAIAKVAAKTSTSRGGTACLDIEARDAHTLIGRLRDGAQFETCTFVTAIDHFPAEPRFEVVWQLHSVAHGDRVRIRARVGGADPRVPTIVDLYPGAAYGERECFDMFGVVFEGHAGLKRLLMPEEYDHFPLRKDFPHQGIEPDRLYREWDRARHLKSQEAAR